MSPIEPGRTVPGGDDVPAQPPGTIVPPVPAQEPPDDDEAPVEEPPPNEPDDPSKTPMIMGATDVA